LIKLINKEELKEELVKIIQALSVNCRDIWQRKEEDLLSSFTFPIELNNTIDKFLKLNNLSDQNALLLRTLVFIKLREEGSAFTWDMKKLTAALSLERDNIRPHITITPFGMYRVLFLSDLNNPTNCAALHLWYHDLNKNPPINGKNAEIHSHRNNAQAWILKGQLIKERFSIKEDTMGFYGLYQVKYSLNKDIVKTTGVERVSDKRYSLVEISKDIYKSGDYYYFPQGQFHRVSINKDAGDITVTLFYQGYDESFGESHGLAPFDKQEDNEVFQDFNRPSNEDISIDIIKDIIS